MNKRFALGGVALLILLVGAIALLKMTRSSDEVPSGRDPGESSTTTTPSTTPSHPTTASHHAAVAPGRPDDTASGSPVDNDSPHELKIEPIKRAFIQRENETGPRPKDAPPPLFPRETIQALRAAATPGVKRCIDESFKRNPDNRNIEDPVSINVIYSAGAAAGTVSVHKADAVIQGTQDDELLTCIETSAKAIEIRGGAAQGDGDGRVQLVFDYK